jgi:hypothetical protein
MRKPARRLATLALCGLLAACAGTPPQSATVLGPASDGQHGRSLLQVQEVFDYHARAFFTLYSARGQENAGLGAGRLVFSFGIAPDGSVSHCEIVSSTFNDPEFEQQVLHQVALLNFGAKDVPAFEVARYPIDFRPMPPLDSGNVR